jgi:phosphoribosylpyrophosphate synthetase
MHTTVPVILREIGSVGKSIDAIAFPDDGAAKRFGKLFPGFPIVVCGKVRDGDKRIVTVQDGVCKGLRLLIVDDMVRSGGTLFECAKALKQLGAESVSAFCAHAAFPDDPSITKKFCKGGVFDIFENFYVTNSVPTVVSRLPEGDVFKVLDILPQIVLDL